jgi:hypothetical protein
MKRQRLVVAALVGFGILAAVLVTTLAAAVSPAHAGSTVQRDAPTTRFYDSRGSSVGSATTYGNTTTFYGANGSVTGRATRQGQQR